MAVLDAENVESADDLGSSRPEPGGRYHVAVKNAEERGPKPDKEYGQVVVEFEVLNGTIPHQEGKTHTEWFSLSPKAAHKVIRFAVSVGLMKFKEKKNVNFPSGIGSHCIVEIEGREYTDRDGNVRQGGQITWEGIWSVDDPKVADVPRDEAMIKLWRERVSHEPPALPEGGAAAQPAPAPQPAAATAGDDLWGDI
jgi:hypothetical protein